jgi:transcription elongation GreA/GreB family factor
MVASRAVGTRQDSRLGSKVRLLAQLIARVKADLETSERAHGDATRGATHEDARQEGDKDMRATEASYVARGQAQRVVELQGALNALEALPLRVFSDTDPVALGALVTIEHEPARVVYFIAPAAGGMRLRLDGVEVRIISPRSPIGQAVLGRAVGDDVSWDTPQGDAEGVIVEVV